MKWTLLVLIIASIPLAEARIQVLPNDASGIDCDDVCANAGGTCLDVGTDAAGTNDKFRQDPLFGCIDSNNNCGLIMASRAAYCEGRQTRWTNCRCELPDNSCVYKGGDWHILFQDECVINETVQLNASAKIYMKLNNTNLTGSFTLDGATIRGMTYRRIMNATKIVIKTINGGLWKWF